MMNKIQPLKNQWHRLKYVLGLCVLLLLLFHIGYIIEFVCYVLFDMPPNGLYAGVASILIQIAIFSVVIGVGLKDQHKTLASVCFFRKVNGRVWAAALLCAIGYTLFSYYLQFLFFSFKYGWSTGGGTTKENLLINVIDTSIIPAVAEEITFKGLIFTILKKYYPTIAAVIIASLMFAVLHLNLLRIIPLLALSCYTFWLYLRSGNIILPIILHFIHNVCTLVLIHEPFNYLGTFYAGLALFLIGPYFLYRASKTSKAENIP